MGILVSILQKEKLRLGEIRAFIPIQTLAWATLKPKKAFLPPNTAIYILTLPQKWTHLAVVWTGGWCAAWPCTGSGVLSDWAGTSQGSYLSLEIPGQPGPAARKHQEEMITEERAHSRLPAVEGPRSPESDCQHSCLRGIWLVTEKSQAMPASPAKRRT